MHVYILYPGLIDLISRCNATADAYIYDPGSAEAASGEVGEVR